MDTIAQWGGLIVATFGALLPIANPFSAAPVFAAASRQFTPEQRNQQARKAAIYMFAILVVALLAGALILQLFGITTPVLRMAGGVLIAKIGFAMLQPEPESRVSEKSQQEAMSMVDIAFTPIAMPLLSGPGSIAVTIGMATHAQGPGEYFAIVIGIAVVAFIAWLVLRSSSRVIEFLGVNGMDALTKVMGFLLVGIGIQFVMTGLFEILTDESIVGAIVDAFRKAWEAG